MKPIIYTLSFYAFFLILGGIFGFLKARSLVSLIMGTGFGLAFAGLTLAFYKNYKIAPPLALLLTSILGIVFIFRFFKTGHFFPAGIMTLLTLGTFCHLLSEFYSHLKWPS